MALFWKIFVSFGIAMTVTLVGTVYVSFQFVGEAFDQLNVEGRERIVEEVAATLASGGERELKAWLFNHPRPASGTVLYVMNERGHELLGRAMPRELLARIKAILRRTSEAETDEPAEITVGRLRVNLRRREAWLGDQSLKLTNAEFVILLTLMRSPGEVVSRESLTRTALGRQLLPDDRSLDTHISNLRRKVGNDSESDELLIRSVRGSGYVLVPPED